MSVSEENKEEEIKIILIGNSGVGKTNLINVAMGQNFNENIAATSSSYYELKKIKINEKEYTVNLWDTIGQEKLRQLAKIFFNNSKIVIFVYDITDKKSFEALPVWIKDVQNQIGDDYIKGIVANKSDLFEKEEVSEEEGQEFANNFGAKFLLTSAKENSPSEIQNYLTELVREYLLKRKGRDTGSFSLTRVSIREKKNKNINCC